MEATVYFDETLIETITISKIDDYTKVIPVDKFLMNNSGSAILVKIIVNNTVIPAQCGLNCTDNRELSMLIDSLGFIASENVSKEIDKHYKRCTLMSQPLVPYLKGFCNVCGSEEYFALENLSMIRKLFVVTNAVLQIEQDNYLAD